MEDLLKLKDKQKIAMGRLSAMLHALSSEVRVQLLHFLSQAPQPVDMLAKKTNQTMANTSMHLRKMHQAHLVSIKVEGNRRIYSLAHPALYSLWENLQDFLFHYQPDLLIDTDHTIPTYNKDIDQFISDLKDGNYTLLDVRPIEEQTFAPELIENFNFIALAADQIEHSSLHLDKNQHFAILCRGRYCALSIWATKLLINQGFYATRLNFSPYSIQQALNFTKEK
jgi:DNA-binding transcriptional ArsR family regulator